MWYYFAILLCGTLVTAQVDEFSDSQITDLAAETTGTLFQGTECPNVPPMDNLALDKITGLWFVIYQLQPSNPCLFWNITRNPNNTNQLIFQEKQIILITDSVGIQLRQFVDGDQIFINIPDSNKRSSMIIDRPVSSPSKVDHFIVFDTDYDSYVAIYECDEGDGFLHRRDVTVLAKKPIHDPVILKRIERLLFNAGIDNSLTEINANLDDNCEFYSPHQFGPTSDRSLNIKNTDMDDDVMVKAIGTARVAFDLFRKNADIANFIKISMDREYNTTWNCLVGLDFDGSVTYKRKTFALFSIGKHNILVFKSPIGLPDN